MIRKQEASEKRKIQKKESKVKNQNKPDDKIVTPKQENEKKESISIKLIENNDVDLENLAIYMHRKLESLHRDIHHGKKYLYPINAEKDDNMSLHISDNNSVSTQDRQRTPNQFHRKSRSLILPEADNIFASLRISNLLNNDLFKNEVDSPLLNNTPPIQIND